MFTESASITGTDTFTGQWIPLEAGGRFNVTFIFTFPSGVTGELAFEVTNGTADQRSAGTARVADLEVADLAGNVSPIAVDAAVDPTEEVFLRDLSGGAVRWTYTNATGSGTLNVDTVVKRV